MGFDPCCDFLLDMRYENLFEQKQDWDFRCKGCGEIIPGRKREAHHKHHRVIRDNRRQRAREQALVKARAAKAR